MVVKMPRLNGISQAVAYWFDGSVRFLEAFNENATVK